jgi:glycosyltransferase involved in cell wall biosynthesis
MTAPRFSVVMPAYNSAGFLAETLASVATQTYRDFEIILVDDRSTDGTADVARERMAALDLAGEVLVRPPHLPKGVSTCRNLALDAARGGWIAFLDSDDLFAPEKLERMAEAVDRSAGVRAFYHQSRRFVDGSGETIDTIPRYGDPWVPRWLLDDVIVGNFHATCGMVIERRLLQEIGGFHSALHGVEDWWLAIQVSARTEWLFVDEPLAHIRVRASSLMTNAPFEHYVRQHLALVRVAEHCTDLDATRASSLRNYVLGPLTQYFAGLAFTRAGWSGLLRGIGLLLRAGEVRAALAVLHRHARTQALGQASRAARRFRPARKVVGAATSPIDHQRTG